MGTWGHLLLAGCAGPSPVDSDTLPGADTELPAPADTADTAPPGDTEPPPPEEVCDGEDQDADGLVDEGVTTTFFRDDDRDGYGTDETVERCELEPGVAEVGGDCDDSDPFVYPGAEEICGDDVVNDCDGTEEDALAACTGATELSSSDASVKLSGAHHDRVGDSLGSPGDVDDDGYADLLVAGTTAYTDYDYTGVVYLVSGPSSDGHVGNGNPRIYGASPGDGLGSGLAGGPAPDGSGSALWIGDADARDDDGRVYLLRTTLGLGDYRVDTVATSQSTGVAEGGRLGRSVDMLADWDGDGSTDLCAGAPGAESAAGAAYLWVHDPGGAAAEATLIVRGDTAGEGVGTTVRDVGDTDGDGLSDFGVGAPGRPGARVSIFRGGSGIVTPSDADVQLDDSSAAVTAGMALDGAGDLDGDGYEDLVIGGVQAGSVGVVHVVLGPPTADLADAWARVEGTSSSFGEEVAALGDLDGDGQRDLLLARPGYGAAGRGYVWLGPSEGTWAPEDLDVTIRGTGSDQDDFAGAIAGPGDMDGDGLDDLALGVWDTSNDEGYAYLFYAGGI